MIDVSKYKKLFIDEAKELLQSLSKSLLIFEKKPENTDALNEMFRSVHTLKGLSATMEYSTIEKLSHGMENIFDILRKGGRIESDTVDALFECLNTLETLVEDVASSRTVKRDISSLYEKLEKISPITKEENTSQKIIEVDFSDAEKKTIEDAKKAGMNCFKISVILSDKCVLKSARAMVVIKEIENRGRIIKIIPNISTVKSGRFKKSFEIVVATKHEPEQIKKQIKNIPEIKSVEISADTTKEGSDTPLRVQQTIRIDIEKMQALQNLVEELSIAKMRLLQISLKHEIPELNEITVTIDRLTSELQNMVMEMRMFPVDYIFDRFPRIVRDLSRKQGKEADLIVEGREIELDRLVQDEINDAVMHLLRNAVDHGIGIPEERRKLGKNIKGKITLSARREGNYVVISVSDDGRGIDPESIKKVAIEKKLMTVEEASKITDNDVYEYLGAPGLSTTKKITDISGRGVGFDVVKSKIKSLGGSVRISSKRNEGTKVELSLPLTTAIIQSLLVGVENEKYAVPLDSVKEIVAVTDNEVKSIERKEIFTYREKILPLLRLKNVLNILGDGLKIGPVVIVERDEKLVGLMVDTLISQQETVVKPLEGMLKGRKEFAGATILGDGTVALILDIGGLI